MKKILITLLIASVVGNVALSLCLRESRYETEQMTKAAQDANDTSDFLMGQHKKFINSFTNQGK